MRSPRDNARTADETLRVLLILFAVVPAFLSLCVAVAGFGAGEPVALYASWCAALLLLAIAASLRPRPMAAAATAAAGIVLLFLWMDAANRAGEGGVAWAFLAAASTLLTSFGTFVVIPAAIGVRALMRARRRTLAGERSRGKLATGSKLP